MDDAPQLVMLVLSYGHPLSDLHVGPPCACVRERCQDAYI